MTGPAIGIDVGSSNVKAARVGAGGRLEASSDRPLRTTRDGDVAEQDAEALWQAVCEAVQEVADPSVRAVGVCSQYSSIVPVDADQPDVGVRHLADGLGDGGPEGVGVLFGDLAVATGPQRLLARRLQRAGRVDPGDLDVGRADVDPDGGATHSGGSACCSSIMSVITARMNSSASWVMPPGMPP